MADGPRPGDFDRRRLWAELEQLLADSRARGFHEAYGAALARDRERFDEEWPRRGDYGNMAAGLLMWITGGWGDTEALEAADALLHATPEDPRRAKVVSLVERISEGTVTWTRLLQIEKKALIRREVPKPPLPPADAIPLADAASALQTMLAEAGASDTPDPLAVWTVFRAFAARAVAAPAPMYIENDMCVFQWAAHEWDGGASVEWDLMRQFVLHDEDGDYDHMEQLHLTLGCDFDDARLGAMGSGDLWSGSDLTEWISRVEALDAFTLVTSGRVASCSVEIDHHEV